MTLLPYWFTHQRWRKWNEVEMRALVQGRIPDADPFLVMCGLIAQVIIAVWLLHEVAQPPEERFEGEFSWSFWVFMVALFGVILLVISTKPSGWPKSTSARTVARARGGWVRNLTSGMAEVLLEFMLGMAELAERGKSSGEVMSVSEKIWRGLFRLCLMSAPPFALGILTWNTIVWLANRYLDDRIGIWLDGIPIEAVGFGFAAVALVIVFQTHV